MSLEVPVVAVWIVGLAWGCWARGSFLSTRCSTLLSRKGISDMKGFSRLVLSEVSILQEYVNAYHEAYSLLFRFSDLVSVFLFVSPPNRLPSDLGVSNLRII